MDNNDLELGLECHGSTANSGGSQHVRKRINIKLKPADKEKKPKASKLTKVNDRQTAENLAKAIQLTTLQSGLSIEPLHKGQKLRWDHKVNLIGDKIIDPLIHTCEDCNLPVLIYGRVLPCKHVFCYKCAKESSNKVCQRCSGKITRVEQCALGTVFVCTFGGTKHGKSGCHRTYLSSRDLQSHIQHRHQAKHISVEPQKDMAMAPEAAIMHLPPAGGIGMPGATYVTQQTAQVPVQQQVTYGKLPDGSFIILQQQPQNLANNQIILNAQPSGHHMLQQHPLNSQQHMQLPQGHLQQPQGNLTVPQSHIPGQQHMQPPPQSLLQQPPQGHIQQQQQSHIQQPPQGHMQQPPQSHMQSQSHLSQGHMQVVQNQIQMPPNQHAPMIQSDPREPFRQMPVLLQQRPSNLITVPLHDEKNDFPRKPFPYEQQLFSPTYTPGRQPPPNQSSQFQGQQFMPQQQRPMTNAPQRSFPPRPLFEEQRDQFGQPRGQPPNWHQGLPRNLIVQQQQPPLQMRPPMSYYR